MRTCPYVYLYINKRRGADSDPDNRADKNSFQSIIRFMNMYVYLCLCIVMYKKLFAYDSCRAFLVLLSRFVVKTA